MITKHEAIIVLIVVFDIDLMFLDGNGFLVIAVLIGTVVVYCLFIVWVSYCLIAIFAFSIDGG